MYTFQDYKESLRDCQRSLELAKKIMKGAGPIKPSPVIKNLRKSLLHLFSRDEFYQVCHDCHGVCCRINNFCFRPVELLCFVAEDPSFKFPEPDWQFLGEKEKEWLPNDRCLFLSDQGCLLKEYRPKTCLAFYGCKLKGGALERKLKEICSEPEREKLFFTETTRYSKAIEDFCDKILETANITRESQLYTKTKGCLTGGVIDCESCFENFEKISKRQDQH